MTGTIDGIGVWPGADLSSRDVIAVAREAERLGLHSVWLSEPYFGRDAIVLAAAAAQATETIRIGTGVVNPYTRHPALLSMGFATLAELAPGRVIYGIGSGEPNWMEGMGYDPSRPRTAVAEALDLYERFFANQAVTDYRGSTTRAQAARFMFRPPAEVPPVVIAAVGPRMCALAKERGRGVLLSVGSVALADVVGRRLHPTPKDFWIGMTIPLAVDDDMNVAVSQVRSVIAGLLLVPEGEAILEMSGCDPAWAGSLRIAIARDGFRRGIEILPQEVVGSLAIIGSEAACLRRLEAFVAAGVNLPILMVGRHGRERALSFLGEAQKSFVVRSAV